MESTWEPRDLPVLASVVEWLEDNSPGSTPSMADLAGVTGFDAMTVWKACRAMAGIYLDLREYAAAGNPEPHRVVAIAPEARRLVGQWPSPVDYLDRLLLALEERASDMEDPDERSKMRRAAEALRGMTRDVAVGVATAALGGAVS